MKIKPISRTIKATALTNPDPSFVSMVKAGANQKPWRAVKMDAAVIADNEEADDMKTKKGKAAGAVVAAVAPKGYGVMQFEFAKSEGFADVDAVKAWMTEGGYEDYEIAETSKSFEISDDAARFEPGSVKRIDGFHKGVAAFVGKLTHVEEDETADEPAVDKPEATSTEKAAEEAPETPAAAVSPPPRKRAAPTGETPEGEDGGSAFVESEKSEEPAAEDAASSEAETTEKTAEPEAPADETSPAEDTTKSEEPVQPGAAEEDTSAEATSDATKAAETIERADKALREKGVYEAAELGCIVNQLGWIVYDADYSGMSDVAVGKIKAAALALLDAFMEVAQDAADQLTEVFRSDEERAQRAAPATEDTPDTNANLDDRITQAVERAVAPIMDQLTQAKTEASEATARADQAERELAERVEADNARGQTRKGAEEPVTTESTDKKPQQRSDASKRMLSAFGSRHSR